ncbi:hypothetical protein QAD02_011372 [Eretmocerus hayati]|uniref:Uncharacterized protein n=1 Tax=Eretmocerus hayati TaxID=131215 RepID=A0ACC2NXR3_9HYME|nr:hypothetical protein QAD02_011372 [Eretmocerus hayati]
MFLFSLCCLSWILCLSEVSSTPISRGDIVTDQSFPFFVSIETSDSLLCGGSIVHSFFAITAAHCFDKFKGKSSYMIRAGSLRVKSGGSKHTIKNIKRHPLYNVYTNLNDIAIIHVGDIFVFDTFRSPIKMFHHGEKIKPGTKATIVGAGWTEKRPSKHLRKASVLIANRDECTSIWINEDGFPIPDSVICAGVGNNRADTCKDDSGGPLIIDGRLAGITSFGYHTCGTPGIPSLYTEVAQFEPWINRGIGHMSKTSRRSISP